MSLVCPNYKSKDWVNLVNHFKNAGLSIKEAETEAARVFLAHDSSMPIVDNLTQIKKDLKFQKSGVSSLKKSKMLVTVSQYNKKNNTSHFILFKPQTPTSYKAELKLNFFPKYIVDDTTSDIHQKVGSYSGVDVETISDPDIYIGKEGGEYVVDGEVYPSYEDATNVLMYQKTNRGNSKPVKELNDFLVQFLDRYGVKVENIDNFMEKYGIDAVAVSDIANKMISVAQDREDSTTLPEEAAHFIIELMGENHSLYKAMDKIIESTPEYEQVVEDYSVTYNNDKTMLKKEAMGKILSDYIIKRHKKASDLPVREETLFTKVYDWFRRIFSKFEYGILEDEKARIFGKVVNDMFGDSLDFKTANLASKKNVFAQVDALVLSINKAIEKLERKAKILEEVGVRGKEQGRAEEIRESLGLISQHIRHNIANKQYAKGIAVYLNYITENDLKFTLEEIEQHLKNPDVNKFSSTQINEMIDLISMYEDTISGIQEIIAFDTKYKDIYNTEINNVSVGDLIKETRGQISFVKDFAEKMHKQKVAEIIEEVKHEDSEYSAKDILESAVGDLSWLQLNFGSLRNAPDEALRMIYRMVSDIHNETFRETLDRGKTLMDLQIEMEKSGISMKEVHETYNGNKTGFMISDKNWGEYFIEKQKAKDAIAKELNYETHSDINFNELSSKDKKYYYKRFEELFRNKYERKLSGQWAPTPPKNEKFQKLMENEAFVNYYNEMKAMMEDARSVLPSKYKKGRKNLLLLPQIRKDIMQTLKDQEGPLLKELGSRVKESLVTNNEDTEFGSTSVNNSGVMRDVNGKVVKLIPIHYTTKIRDTNQLSNDVTSMVVKFYEMATNFSEMSKKVDDLTIIQRAIGNRTYTSKDGKTGGTGVDSNSYKALDQFLDSFVYGKVKDTGEWKIPGTKTTINTSKLTDMITNFVRGNNLFLNIPTTISGYTKAGIDSFIDRQVNNYTSNESGWWAEKEFDLNIADIFANLGKRKKFGKVSLMFEYNAIFNGIHDTFNRLDMKSKLGRANQSDLIYSTYALADLRIKGKLALAVYNNYRLVDGKFITKRQFDRKYKDSTKKWSDYKNETLYDAYEIQDGKFKVKKEYKDIVSKKLENTVRNIITQRGATVDGQLTHLDRPAIAKSMMGRFIMIHRGWLISGLSERFKSKGINYETGEMEEGFYRSTGRTIMALLSTKGGIKSKLATWNNLDDFQKKNTIKMIIDLSFSALVLTMSIVMNNIVDDADEDDWWIQYLGYQMNRIRLEQMAFISGKEAMNILNSPTAASNLFDSAASLINLATDWDKIEYGAYEGMYRFEKALIKNSLLKNIWELQAPEQKNKFLRSQIF
jgi:hypothetical protein